MDSTNFLWVDIQWDFDILEHSLRRGYLNDYNFYAIFLDRKKEFWRSIDPNGSTELYYIGSTRMNSVSNRLLNNHDGLESALQDGFGDLHLGLGKWSTNADLSIKGLNDLIRDVESALIYKHMPTRNTVNRLSYKGIPLKISNSIHSVGGVHINDLIFSQTLTYVDQLKYSSLTESLINNYFLGGPDLFNQGLIQLLARVDLDFPQLTEEFQLS